MLVLTKNERIVLNAVRKKLASTPRDLEELMPNDLSAKETRVAVQSLLRSDAGKPTTLVVGWERFNWLINNFNVQKRLKTSNKAVFNVNYHIIWCPKYRLKILVGKIKERLNNILLEKAEEIEIKIVKVAIMSDHIHLFLECNPKISPNIIVKYLKGYSSRELRKEFSSLKRNTNLWSRSYYCESVGHISEATIKKYIDNQ